MKTIAILIVSALLTFSLLAEEPKPAPPKPVIITSEQQAEYQTLRARFAEAQAVLLQAKVVLDGWITKHSAACEIQLNGDQITCKAQVEPAKPETKPKDK